MLDNLFAFIELGFRHILPQGLDHVLFVAALYLNARGWTSLLMQVTAFTLAHTLTLALAATGVVQAPLDIIEPLIALSIAVLALEAVFFEKANAWRLPVIFAFGLFHGLGFGSVMQTFLQNADLVTGLAGVTIGVEAGHLVVLLATAVIAFAARFALKTAGKPDLYRRVFVQPAAAIIALVGLYWFFQRVGLIPE